MPDTIESPPVADRIEQSLFHLHDAYRKHQDFIKSEYKISALEMQIIQWIVLEGPRKMKEIGEHFNVKLSTLTSIIDKIERQKMVKRVPSREDRRVVFLEVTARGRNLYTAYCSHIHSLSEKVKAQLTEEQLLVLIEGLETVSGLVSAD